MKLYLALALFIFSFHSYSISKFKEGLGSIDSKYRYFEKKCNEFKNKVDTNIIDDDSSNKKYFHKFNGSENDVKHFLSRIETTLFVVKDFQKKKDDVQNHLLSNCSLKNYRIATSHAFKQSQCVPTFLHSELYRTLAEESKLKKWSQETKKAIIESFKSLYVKIKKGDFSMLEANIALALLGDFEEFKLIKLGPKLNKIEKKADKYRGQLKSLSSNYSKYIKDKNETDFCNMVKKSNDYELNAASDLISDVLRLLNL